MPDQPSDTSKNKNAIKLALGAALGSALGIITAVRTLSAGKRAGGALTPRPPSPRGKGEQAADVSGRYGEGYEIEPESPPPVSGGRVPSGQEGVGSLPSHPDWERLPPAHLPRPTYWPVVLALAIVFLAWGIVTTFAISVIGLALFALGLGGWIGELWHGGE